MLHMQSKLVMYHHPFPYFPPSFEVIRVCIFRFLIPIYVLFCYIYEMMWHCSLSPVLLWALAFLFVIPLFQKIYLNYIL